MPDNNHVCELCGEPMPVGEEMFKFHGYSGPCPKSPPSKPPDNNRTALELVGKFCERSHAEYCDSELGKPCNCDYSDFHKLRASILSLSEQIREEARSKAMIREELRTRIVKIEEKLKPLSWSFNRPEVPGHYWFQMPGCEPEILSTKDLAKIYQMIPIGETQPFRIAGPIPEVPHD